MAAILVVEDVPVVLLSLRMVLEGAGHRVTAAADGAAGLAMLKQGSFDLVITDIWMPGASGTALVQEGRRIAPATRFLAITGGDPNGRTSLDASRNDSFGADRLMIKPFEKEELLDAVADLLAVPAR